MFDYIILAFFAAFLGLKFAKTRATGHLWFLIPLVLVVGLNQGWASQFGETFFVIYRILLLASCVLAAYMYYRDYHKRKADQIAKTAQKRKAQAEQYRKGQTVQNAKSKNSGKNKKK